MMSIKILDYDVSSGVENSRKIKIGIILRESINDANESIPRNNSSMEYKTKWERGIKKSALSVSWAQVHPKSFSDWVDEQWVNNKRH